MDKAPPHDGTPAPLRRRVEYGSVQVYCPQAFTAGDVLTLEAHYRWRPAEGGPGEHACAVLTIDRPRMRLDRLAEMIRSAIRGQQAAQGAEVEFLWPT